MLFFARSEPSFRKGSQLFVGPLDFGGWISDIHLRNVGTAPLPSVGHIE